MKTRKLFILFAALLPLLSCKKVPSLSDQPFTIEMKTVQSKAVWADIVPEYNDFYYTTGTVSVKEYEEKYKTDAALVTARDKEDKYFWETNFKGKISFKDSYLYQGAYFVKSTDLVPETDYYVYAFPYDNDDNPVYKLVKQRFTTKAYKQSDIDFTLSLSGSELSVLPSNNDDTYYFDYDTVESVEDDFAGSPSIFYHYLIYKYEEYGFMAGLSCRGPKTEKLSDCFEMKPGMTFYWVGSGYENGINSDYRIFKLTYAGEGLPGTVERIKDPILKTKVHYTPKSYDRTKRAGRLH